MACRRIIAILKPFRQGWRGIFDIFYPHVCVICGESIEDRKELLCSTCLLQLPRTQHAELRGNSVEQIFEDIPLRHSLVRGGTFCYYEYGSTYRELIHTFKYRNQPQIGTSLGQVAAKEFALHGFFDGIDYLVPVPLHRKRVYKRTYNQAEIICEGLAEVIGIKVDTTHLKRRINNESQTKKTAEERQRNTQGIFEVNQPEDWEGKHILLVDDIITTGATMKACMQAMRKIKGLRVSVFALGIARIPILIEE